MPLKRKFVGDRIASAYNRIGHLVIIRSVGARHYKATVALFARIDISLNLNNSYLFNQQYCFVGKHIHTPQLF